MLGPHTVGAKAQLPAALAAAGRCALGGRRRRAARPPARALGARPAGAVRPRGGRRRGRCCSASSPPARPVPTTSRPTTAQRAGEWPASWGSPPLPVPARLVRTPARGLAALARCRSCPPLAAGPRRSATRRHGHHQGQGRAGLDAPPQQHRRPTGHDRAGYLTVLRGYAPPCVARRAPRSHDFLTARWGRGGSLRGRGRGAKELHVPPHRAAQRPPARDRARALLHLRRRGPRGRRSVGLVVAALGLVAAFAAGGCAPAPVVTTTTVLSGLSSPWDLASRPTATSFFTERWGRINVYDSGVKRALLATPPDSAAVGEGGMMGIAVDPAFATNRRIYMCFMSNASGALDVRLVRWRLNADQTPLTERTDILTGIPANSTGATRAAVPASAPTATCGSAPATPPSTPTRRTPPRSAARCCGSRPAAPARRATRAGRRPARDLHLRPSQRAGPGLRPLRHAYSIEHGPDRDDEVNLLVRRRQLRLGPGPPGYNEAVPMTDLTKFPNARLAAWCSGLPTIAPSGGTFLPAPSGPGGTRRSPWPCSRASSSRSSGSTRRAPV